MTINFGQGSGANKTFNIVSTGATSGINFKGDIDISTSAGGEGSQNVVNITLGNGTEDWGKLYGRVQITGWDKDLATGDGSDNLKGSPRINFKNNTEITNGIWATGGENKGTEEVSVVFKKEAKVNDSSDKGAGETFYTNNKKMAILFKGNATITNKLGDNQTSGNYAFISSGSGGGISATFEGNATIEGSIGTTLGQQNRTISNTYTFLGASNTITGRIYAEASQNTLTFKNQTNSHTKTTPTTKLTGQIITTRKAINLAESSIKNVLNFYDGAEITFKNFSPKPTDPDRINNSMIYADIGTNELTFYATDKVTADGFNVKINGIIEADGSGYVNTQGGTNIINFKNASEASDMVDSVNHNSTKATLENLEAVWYNDRKGTNRIVSSVTNLDLTIGDILSEYGGRTYIDATGTNNTLKLGKLNVTIGWGDPNTEIGVHLHNTTATNKLTIKGLHNTAKLNLALEGANNIATIQQEGILNIETTNIALYNTNGGDSSNTLEIQGVIDNTKTAITNIGLTNLNGTGTNKLTTKDINSVNDGSQVNIYFGETQVLPSSQSVSKNAFILSPQASTMATVTNTATINNITNTNNAKTNISMKGTTNTLEINRIKTGGGDNTRTKVTINLQGTTSSTATIQDITNEKSVSLTLGNATTESATNVLNLKQVASTGGGRIADIQFGKGVNTINAIDLNLITFTSTDNSQNKIGFTADAGENAKITLTSDVLSNGNSISNGAMFNIGASQTIELANSSGSNTLKTLTTTGSSQIHFLGESGSFRGNLTTAQGNGTDSASGGNTKIILDSGIGTANLYTTANTTAGKMTFELNGNASASQTLALGGNLTTQEGAMTDFNFKQAGVYHLTQAEGASEARIVTGGVTNFNFASGESTLSFGTLQDGVSPASNPIAFDDTSHTGNFVFNLNSSDLTLLGSASDGVNRIFNASNATLTDQSVSSALRETIKVTNGATTTFNLLNEGDTLTLYKGVNVENGSSVVNFNANKQTLNLFGADSLASGVATQENTLYTFSTLSATNTASTQNAQNTQNPQNPTINLVNSDMPQKDRTNFNLLMIGVDPSSGANLVGADKGYLAENATFRIFVNEAQALHSNGSATLGGQKIDNSQDQASNSLGHAYSDRIIIGSIGDSTTPKHATLYLFPQLENLSGFKYTHLAGNKTGTETKDNVALATIANNDKGEALVTLEAKNVFVGVEAIQVNLETAITDIGGKIILNSQDKEQLGQTYTTYFLGSVESRGASESMQEISATALSLNYDLFLANFNSLNKRMGELRNNPNDNGIWARVFGGQFNSNYKVKNDVDYITTQAGYDYGFDLDGEARNYLGLAVSYATSKSSVGSLLQGSAEQNIGNSNVALSLDNVFSQGVEVALYNSYVSNVGWYSDTIFKFSYMMSEFNLKNNNFISPKAQTNNFGFVLSEEVGYRFKLGKKKEWFIDPQVELAFGYLSDNTYQTQAQAGAGLVAFTGIADAILNLRTRVGSAFGYEVQSQQTSASIYVGAFYEFDYVNGGDASTILRDSLTTPHMNVLSSSGRAVLNVGSNISLQDHTRLYFDVEKSFGDKLKTHLQFNAGVRYSFGNKNPKHNRENLSKELNAPLKIETKKGE